MCSLNVTSGALVDIHHKLSDYCRCRGLFVDSCRPTVWVTTRWGCALSITTTPAGRQDYLQELLAIRQDPQVIRRARARAGDLELAEDALQETYAVMARIKDPGAIEDLRAYFCRVLIRVINVLRGQLGAILPADFTALADTCQPKVRGEALQNPVPETVATHLLAHDWLERFNAEREFLTAAVPGRSPDPFRYREIVASVAEKVLRSIITADVCDADGNPALCAAYPEWFADDGGTASNTHQRFSRARADVRCLLRAIVNRDDLYA
jgi:DNA-directed RNA polymerase specialized sigma24 family protein